jgi:predicted proteasome-type protease
MEYINKDNSYYSMIAQTCGEGYGEVFAEIQAPIWEKHPQNFFEINEDTKVNSDSLDNIKVSPPDALM